MDVVALLSQGRTAAAQCGLFTYKSVPVIFEPPCTYIYVYCTELLLLLLLSLLSHPIFAKNLFKYRLGLRLC